MGLADHTNAVQRYVEAPSSIPPEIPSASRCLAVLRDPGKRSAQVVQLTPELAQKASCTTFAREYNFIVPFTYVKLIRFNRVTGSTIMSIAYGHEGPSNYTHPLLNDN